jgi:hypothetical protein
MTFTTRSWSGTTALLCVLLLQNCQSNSLRATEEEALSASPSSASAMHEHTPSEPMAVRSLALPTSLSTTLASEEVLSTALFSSSLGPVAFSTRPIVNSSTAPYGLPAVAMSRASSAVPLGTPGRASSPDDSRVCEGKVEEVLRAMPGDEGEEDSKLPAQQRSTNLASEGDLASKELHTAGKWGHGDIRRDALNILLAMAGSEPPEAIQFMDVLLVAAQDKSCRHQALEALGKVAQASPAMFCTGLSSLRAAAKGEDKAVRLLALKTLGEVKWKHYFGEVEPAPDLPGYIDDILDSACPFWPEKQVKDTHLLVLMPATVDGEPFTLNLLGELIQRPKNGGHETKYSCYTYAVKAQFGAASPTASYWLLMTRDVLPGSRDKSYSDQKELVADYARRTGLPYELPKALEVATAILTHHVRDGERLYSASPWTYTRCQELIRSAWEAGTEYPIIVGGFDSPGLDIYKYGCDCRSHGVAGLRKF